MNKLLPLLICFTLIGCTKFEDVYVEKSSKERIETKSLQANINNHLSALDYPIKTRVKDSDGKIIVRIPYEEQREHDSNYLNIVKDFLASYNQDRRLAIVFPDTSAASDELLEKLDGNDRLMTELKPGAHAMLYQTTLQNTVLCYASMDFISPLPSIKGKNTAMSDDDPRKKIFALFGKDTGPRDIEFILEGEHSTFPFSDLEFKIVTEQITTINGNPLFVSSLEIPLGEIDNAQVTSQRQLFDHTKTEYVASDETFKTCKDRIYTLKPNQINYLLGSDSGQYVNADTVKISSPSTL